MERKLLNSTKKMSRKEAGEKLHNLADSIAEGYVKLKSGENSVDLQPGEQVEFELEVEKEEDGDTSIEIEVEWPETEKTENIEIQ
ncbi:amphi-Trp domain-containing protein [Candidatus Nanohalobium constans]|uniref:Amphi-Trp domain-containing protein n=1 Tax=Candidatus Nanohalobium constans TaxID=2565781 RepID=A0A5Q0UHX4_9ARCH|nr:amphi-Trp domain-containing protein [Candidatus Nanohalobium constans]QGA80489.1 amphi-Trp domain-containing protein [Candidatus Nanohalobium constans]